MSAEAIPSFKTSWDTSYVPERDRFSYFREGVCQAFFAYSPLPPSDGVLDARIETAAVDGGLISRIGTTPLEVTRTSADFSRIPDDLYSLGFSDSGGLEGIAAGTHFFQGRNQMSLVSVDAVERFQLAPNNRYSTVALIFQKARLRDAGAGLRFRVLNSAKNTALESCLRLIRGRLDDGSQEELSCLMDASIALLTASLIGDPDFWGNNKADDATSRGILLAIKEFVRQHIRDREMNTTSVAEHFGLSLRYVQKIFAEEGLTLNSYITRIRLEHVARDLVDPRIAKASVADIAERWGYRDMATFHRNFRRHFDDTPKQMRMRLQSPL